MNGKGKEETKERERERRRIYIEEKLREERGEKREERGKSKQNSEVAWKKKRKEKQVKQVAPNYYGIRCRKMK